MKPIRLVSGFLTVGFWTLLSRILGFVRDIFIASRLGDGPAGEAFLIAFALPNMFRRFFAEGAFNMAFVPMFSKKLESGEDPEGFARDAFAGLATILIVFSGICSLVMPWLVLTMASGFAGDIRFELATGYGRVVFPYIFFISLAALLSGILNATGRFMAAAAAPILLNVVLIAAIQLAPVFGWEFGWALAWSAPIAGVLQLALVWWAAAKAGFQMRPRMPRITPELRQLAIIAAPAALAGGVVQINLLVGRQVASFFDGAIMYLNLADRLYQLPLGVVAIAIGVVLLPDLSRRLQAGDTTGGADALNRAAEFALFLTVPAAVALVLVPHPIVSVLYERGRFDSDAVLATAQVTAIYGMGLPAFVLQKVLQPLYFARHDTKGPFRYALFAMVVNAVLAIGLAPVIGFVSAALATVCASWVMVVLLWFGSRKMGEAAQIDARLRRRAGRIIVASVVMGVVLVVVAWILGDSFASRLLRVPALFALVGAGIVTYFGVAQAIGAFSLSELKSTLKRRGDPA